MRPARAGDVSSPCDRRTMPLDVVTPEIRRYLLGDLDEAAATALEDRYVADPALQEDVRAAEDALIEAFLDGRLRPAERARFEAHYLASPIHRDRLAIARALHQRTKAPSSSVAAGGPFYGWLALAAAVVLASLWLVSRGGPPPQQAVVPPSPPGASAPAPAPAPVSPPVPAPAPVPSPVPSPARTLLALTLSPITTRGSEQEPFVRPAGPVDLALALEGAPVATDRAYDVALQTVDGRAVWRGRSRAAVTGSGLLTTVRLPVDTLPADDYVVVVTTPGRDERGRYVLRLRSR